jgi:TP901 family phage tail tape measure protein
MLGALGQQINSFSSRVSNIGKKLRITGAGLLGAGLGASLVTGLNVVPGQILRIESALNRLTFTERFNPAQIKQVSTALKQMSKDTLQSQEDLIPAIDTIGDAGFNLNETLSILPNVAKAATAFGKPVSELAASAFTLGSNFKIASGDMSEALDIVAQLGSSNLDISELNELLGKAGTSAKSLGGTGVASLRQVSAALQVVRSQTGSSTQATKTLSKLYESIVDPSVQKKFLEGPGINVSKRLEAVTKNGGDALKEYMLIVNEAVHQGNPTLLKQQERLAELFGASDGKAVQALIGNLKDYDDALAESGNARGTIEKGFQGQLQTTLGQWQLFKLSLQSSDFKPLTSTFKFLNKELKAFNSNGENSSKLITGVATAIIGGGALIALGQLTLALKNVGRAIIFISDVLPILSTAIVSNPILSLVAGLAAIGAFAFWQAKKSADAVGTEGLQRGSTARKLLDQSGSVTPLSEKVSAMHKGFEASNPFSGVKAPILTAPTGPEKVQVDVTLKGVPPGSKVETKTTKGMQLNTDISMGLAYPR